MAVDLSGIEVKEGIERPVYLQYHYKAGRAITRFLHAVREGRLIGERSPGTGKVLVPPLGSCPESGKPTLPEAIELAHSGTVLMFTVVHLPIPGSRLKPPFVVAYILLDGADQTFSHLISRCEPGDVQVGTRVRAVWKPESEWDFGLENIEFFEPTGEPPVDVEQLRERRQQELQNHA